MPVLKKVNGDFFKKWTPEMAYVLGFFAADGYITINKRGGQFWCIQITDKKLLEKIRKAIKSNHKIGIRYPRKVTEKESYRLQIGSKEMCGDLKKLGFNKRKTLNISIPNMPNKLYPFFVRGYFDGDGNVWVGEIHKDRKKKSVTIRTIFTSCSIGFLEKLKSKLEEFGITKGVIGKQNNNYHRLTYSVQGSLKLYNFMYNHDVIETLFLGRKKRVFDKYINCARSSTVEYSPVTGEVVGSAPIGRAD